MDPPPRPTAPAMPVPSSEPQQQQQQPGSASPLPRLEILDPSKSYTFSRPSKCINDGPDVAHFSVSLAYRDIGLFLMQLNRAMCPRKPRPQQQQQQQQPKPDEGASASASASLAAQRGGTGTAKAFTIGSTEDPPAVRALQRLLERAGALIDDAPPDPGPRRFGNVAFRKWHQLLEDSIDELLRVHLGDKVLSFGAGGSTDVASAAGESDTEAKPTALDELRAYFLGGFGSNQRLDYGTGHELSFFAFLGCLWKLGFFKDSGDVEDLERSIVLGVIEPYLVIVRRLILTYNLEPAGSHGVWGLDDHSFIPYIFGSAQLAAPIAAGSRDPVPQAGSLPRAPRPGDITKADLVADYRRRYMYFSAVGFINDVKTGPFWEHSPVLFDVSGVRDGWAKINKGMLKMYDAEVLGKFPVVQHFPFGSLFSWGRDPVAAARAPSVHVANQPAHADPAAGNGNGNGGGGGGGGGGVGAPVAVPPPPTGMPGQTVRPGVNERGMMQMGGQSIPGQDSGLGHPMGRPGTTGAQMSLTKAPWAK